MTKNIDNDFKNAQGSSILFLGKFHSLSRTELEIFLEKFEIKYTDTLDDEVAMVVEGSIISPLEEDIAYDAYKKKIAIYNTEAFEKLYAHNLNDDALLMSLKLSNDQDRLTRLLHNTHLDKALFLKLFAMYDWGEDGLFESSENMEMCTLFAKRFFHKDRFDPATFYSPISIFEIAIMSEDEMVLQTLLGMPEINVKQSRNKDKRPKTIKEALATNHFLNQESLKKLLRQNDKDIDYFLAQNATIDKETANILLSRADTEIKTALASNETLSDEIFETLLHEEALADTLLQHQKIDITRFEKLIYLHPNIGANENLSSEVVDRLIAQADEETLKLLSENQSIHEQHLTKIYNINNAKLFPYLAKNRNLSQEIIQELFEKNDKNIELSLAENFSIPKEIIDTLYNKDDYEINKHLALNESLPIEYLQQLQLDTRLMNHLKENKTFTQNILNNLGI